MTLPALFFLSAGLTLLFGTLVLRYFPRWGLMDRPERYGHERAPIPYPGGIAIFGAVLVTVLVALPMDSMLVSVLSGAILLVVTSFVDDRRGVSPFLRLGIQFLAGCLLVLGGIGIASVSNPFGDPLVLDSVEIPFTLGELSYSITLFADALTVLWVIVMVNAFNWIDGVPGMSSAVAAVAAAILLALSLRPDFHAVDQTVAIVLATVVLASSVAFLVFNVPPPKMLMGDTGSMLLGFLIATIAIISGGKIATTLLVLGFPILDFVWVIGRRLLQGQSPFKGDLWHFHHRLLKAGYSERQVVVFFALTAGVFGSLSLMLHTEGKAVAFAAIVGVMIMLALLLYSRK